ncbi:hypothetical protein, partial [Paraburkholderia hospita]|uniref:hypothetical protein n=1 Tax=Paraburkholderia hospita TaxID=169430 RepID=UPI001EE68001
LLFFAAAKKSRCRPAQGRRLKREGKARMPAQTRANHTSVGRQIAEASPHPQANQTARAAKAPH